MTPGPGAVDQDDVPVARAGLEVVGADPVRLDVLADRRVPGRRVAACWS